MVVPTNICTPMVQISYALVFRICFYIIPVYNLYIGQDPAGLIIPIEGHTSPVRCVCFSVDCYYVLVCVGCVGLIYRVKVSLCMCACVCVYVRACVCACVRACVCICVWVCMVVNITPPLSYRMAGWTQQLVDTLAPSHVQYSHIITVTMWLLELRTGHLWYNPQVTQWVCHVFSSRYGTLLSLYLCTSLQ